MDATTLIAVRMHYFKITMSYEGKLSETRHVLKRYKLILAREHSVENAYF